MKSCPIGYVSNCRLFLRKHRGHIHHHCELDCICQRSSRSAFPLSDVELQDLEPESKPSAWSPEFRKHHDLLHQGILSILSVWRVSTVYPSPCLFSIRFLNGSDQGSYTDCLSLSRRVHSTSACNTSSVHRQAVSWLSG